MPELTGERTCKIPAATTGSTPILSSQMWTPSLEPGNFFARSPKSLDLGMDGLGVHIEQKRKPVIDPDTHSAVGMGVASGMCRLHIILPTQIF